MRGQWIRADFGAILLPTSARGNQIYSGSICSPFRSPSMKAHTRTVRKNKPKSVPPSICVRNIRVQNLQISQNVSHVFESATIPFMESSRTVIPIDLERTWERMISAKSTYLFPLGPSKKLP